MNLSRISASFSKTTRILRLDGLINESKFVCVRGRRPSRPCQASQIHSGPVPCYPWTFSQTMLGRPVDNLSGR